MSKTRARERAKARKGRKREVRSTLNHPQKSLPEGFNTQTSIIKNPRTNVVKNLSVTKRGSSRSG